MAKDQGLSLNSEKISGVCGRLMCCLRYEYDVYRDFNARAPKQNATVQTPDGPAKVVDHDVPREMVSLKVEGGKPVKVPVADLETEGDAVRPNRIGEEAWERATERATMALAGGSTYMTSQFTGKDKLAKAGSVRHVPASADKGRARGGASGGGASAGAGPSRKPRRRHGSKPGAGEGAQDASKKKQKQPQQQSGASKKKQAGRKGQPSRPEGQAAARGKGKGAPVAGGAKQGRVPGRSLRAEAGPAGPAFRRERGARRRRRPAPACPGGRIRPRGRRGGGRAPARAAAQPQGGRRAGRRRGRFRGRPRGPGRGRRGKHGRRGCPMRIDYELLTDLYQLTMAQGYWEAGKTGDEACFHMYFRDYPFKGGYAVACGMAQLAEIVDAFSFSDEDVAYLAGLPAPGGGSLFKEDFLRYLARDFRLSCDIDAVAEGTVVFPHEPLVRATGPIVQCQLLETALLNCVNFETLVATKAARVCLAAAGAPWPSSGCAAPRGRPAACGRAARRWWAAAPPPPTSWPASFSASRFRGRTRTPG